MAHYFNNLPLIQYNGKLSRSLISRAAISQETIKNSSVFYPYTNKHNERADTLAYHYYQSSYMDWLLYYANDIIDPYYGWYLTQEQFQQYLADKYGSLYDAQVRVHHFQVDWAGDDRKLTPAAYDALPAVAPTNTKQYWRPVVDESTGAPLYYVRKRMDSMLSTNQVARIDVGSTAGFVEGEVVSQFDNGILNGYAEIIAITDTTLTVQRVVGTFTLAAPIVGFDSSTSQTPTAVVVISRSIPAGEEVYWRHVTVYEYEDMLNEQRKILRVVGKQHAEQAEATLTTLFG